jgi:histidine ammonia-lyase
VRAVDLAVYADALAGEADALAARIERARAQLRQLEIEREAREALTESAVSRLEALGYFRPIDEDALCCALEVWARSCEALGELQTWVEGELSASAQRGARATSSPPSSS